MLVYDHSVADLGDMYYDTNSSRLFVKVVAGKNSLDPYHSSDWMPIKSDTHHFYTPEDYRTKSLEIEVSNLRSDNALLRIQVNDLIKDTAHLKDRIKKAIFCEDAEHVPSTRRIGI